METENNSKAHNEAGLVDSGAGQEPEVQATRSTRDGKSLNHAVGSNSSNTLTRCRRMQNPLCGNAVRPDRPAWDRDTKDSPPS